MKRSRFSEKQIVGIQARARREAKTDEVCRKHGISGAMFYKWRAKYGAWMSRMLGV